MKTKNINARLEKANELAEQMREQAVEREVELGYESLRINGVEIIKSKFINL